MSSLARFGVSLDRRLLEKFDELIAAKGYTNRSEAIRDLVRSMFVEEECAQGRGEAAGTVSLIYNHHTSHLTQTLTDIQHHWVSEIVSSLHIHLDADNCLEVLVLRGKAREIKRIADRLIGLRGVKHGKLAMTGTGADLY